MKVGQTWKPENDAGGQKIARPTVGPGQSLGQAPEAPKFSCFQRPMNLFQTAEMLAVKCE